MSCFSRWPWNHQKNLDQSRTGDGKLTTTVSEKPELFNRVSYIAASPSFFFSQSPSSISEPKGGTAHDSYSVRRGQITARVQYWTRIDQITSWSSLECDEYPPDRPVPTRWKITFFKPYLVRGNRRSQKVHESSRFFGGTYWILWEIRLQNSRYSSNVASNRSWSPQNKQLKGEKSCG